MSLARIVATAFRSTRPSRGSGAGLQRSGAGAVVLLLVASCASPTVSTTPSAVPSTPNPPSESAAPIPSGPPTAQLEDVATFDVTVEVAPDWPTLLDDSLWVLAPDGPEPAVVRLDPTSGAEQARIPLPGGFCEAIASGFGSVWACTPDGIARIDPATNAIVATVAFPTPEFYGRPAVTEDAVWAVSGEIVPTDLVRIDPATNAVTGTYPLGHTIARLAYGFGSLWATAARDGLLLRIDPSSGAVEEAASDLVGPWVVATGAGRVWVGLQGVGTDEDPDPSIPDLFRYAPDSQEGEFLDFDLRPESIGDIVVNDEAAWIQAIGPFLMRLDPESAAIESTVSSDLGTGALVVSDEALWMTVWRADSVVRIDP